MFNIPITLPSGKKVRVNELKNRHYLCIIKFCTNNDLEGLSMYFKQVLFEEFNICRDLNYIDICYILIYIRMVFISPTIQIQGDKPINVELGPILNNMEDLDIVNNRNITVDGVDIEVGLPTEIYFDNIDDLIISSIYSVSFNGKKIDFLNISQEDKIKVITVLPAKLYASLTSFVRGLNDKLGSILVVKNNTVFKIDEFKINAFSNQLLHFIKNIYTENLSNFFHLMYHYNNKVIHDATLFMELSPIDSNILFNLYRKEIEDKNKESKKENP